MKIEKIGSIHGNNKIWRYMSLEKFIDLLLSRSLFFANANKMEDKFEMAVPIFPKSESKAISDRGSGMIFKRELSQKEIELANKFKENTYISCWSLNDAESYALWKIYLGGSSNGVAIKSTVSKLIHCLESVSHTSTSDYSKLDFEAKNPFFEIDTFKIGIVEYKNHIEPKNLNKTNLAITKKQFYDYEKELRVFGTSKNQFLSPVSEEYQKGLSNGFSIPIEIELLIDEIVLSPYSTAWFKENLIKLIGILNSDLSSKILDSEIGINS